MKQLKDSLIIALLGLVTSLIVAYFDALLARTTGFHLFGFSVWAIIPAGAFIVGLLAASGYYFGAFYLHRRANTALFFQMVAIAGLTQVFIYWLGYTSAVTDDGSRASQMMSFWTYLQYVLTHEHLRIGRLASDTGPIGDAGYLFAALQFIGFLLGGASIFLTLKSLPFCAECNFYFRTIAMKHRQYVNWTAASAYYDKLFTLPLQSEDFRRLVRSESKARNISRGAITIQTKLLGCPKCKQQIVNEQVSVHNGETFVSSGSHNRIVSIPKGIDLTRAFLGAFRG